MSDKKKTTHNKELSARLMAVQAYYQNLQNKKPMSAVISEYLKRGLADDEIDEEFVQPHGGLFKRILSALDDRGAEVNEILSANINKKEIPADIIEKENDEADQNEEQEEEQEEEPIKRPEKEIEPLLKSILLCGTSELLCHQDIDKALIIDDYLNVTHAFYEKQQVSFVNGVLDKIATLVRE